MFPCQRYITYTLIDSSTMGPLGASGFATYEMVDVNLHGWQVGIRLVVVIILQVESYISNVVAER